MRRIYSEKAHRWIYNDNSHRWREHLMKILLVICTTAAIVWVLPRTQESTMKYDLGKPWSYGTFIAQFDFPILRSDESMKHDRDSISKHFEPYFTYDENIENRQTELLASELQNLRMPYGYIQSIIKLTHEIYQRGVLEDSIYNVLARDTTRSIRLISGRNATVVGVRDKYNVSAATDMIYNDPVLSFIHDDLKKANMERFLVPNIIYDAVRTETECNDLIATIPRARGMVQSGQKIIERGDIVDEYDYSVLKSYEKEMNRRASALELLSTFAGQAIFVLVIVILFTCYLQLYRDDYFEKPRSIIMLYLLLTIFPILVSLMVKHNFFSVYVLPITMAPMFIRVFMDSRTAFLTHAMTTMLCAVAVKYQYEFILVQLSGGLVAIFTLRELSRRSQVFIAAVTVTIVELLVYETLLLMQNGEHLFIDSGTITYFTAGGVLLLLTYPLMFIVEKVFGFISTVTLFELSDTNKDLLRRLSEVAPGTFQHSITVSNLASEIAKRIGAKPLLVRVGALYHDIGKMSNPVFFTENQIGVNPHKQLSEQESAQVIIRHIADGQYMAEKANLPEVIIDFIRTHHGAGMARYFYVQYKNNHPDEVVDEAPFTYPGPNPFTQEQAILMMADATEAAARSLQEYTLESITALVNRIIDGQVQQGFFRECPITFRDIAVAKEVLIENLLSIYHTRVVYPELKK